MKTLRFAIGGMSCSGCRGGVESCLKPLAYDKQSASVDLATQVATITVSDDTTDETIINAVIAAGFTAERLTSPFAPNSTSIYKPYRNKAILSLGLALPLFLLHLLGLLPAVSTEAGYYFNGLLALVTTALMHFAGGDFYRKALSGKLDMNSLIALSTSSAWLLSMGLLLMQAAVMPLQFIPILMILGVMNSSLGIRGYLKYSIAQQLPSQEQQFYAIQPQKYRVRKDRVVGFDKGVDYEYLPVAKIKANDYYEVRRNERFPVAGKIIKAKGVAQVEKLFGNGEPVSLAQVDDKVAVGDLNKGAWVIVQATENGDPLSLLNAVKHLAPEEIQYELLDRISAWFVPAVIAIAAITGLSWLASGAQPLLMNASTTTLSVLLAACPCSLGLAIPLATKIAVKKLAEQAIFVKDTGFLHKIKSAKMIVFDKTGTLTTGECEYKGFTAAIGFAEATVLPLVASLEQASMHPLATSLVAYANKQKITLSVPTTVTGTAQGLSGLVKGRAVHVGSLSYLQAQNIDVSTSTVSAENTIYCAIDLQYVGCFSFKDVLRDDAKPTVQYFREQGLQVMIATGSDGATQVASELAIPLTNVKTQQTLEDKAAYIRELQEDGGVIMVGDGGNDMQALCQADAGIAVKANAFGANVCVKDLTGLQKLHQVTDKTIKNVYQNLAISAFCNLISLLLASGLAYAFGWIAALMPPTLAAVLMAGSSLSVVANSYRLLTPVAKILDPSYQPQPNRLVQWWRRLATG